MENDLLIKTGHQIEDIGRTLSWGAFGAFLKKEEADSALFKELNPEIAAWSGTMKTNAILADIFDVLTSINANLVAIGSGKHAKKPKPYPRPWKTAPDEEKHFGKDALPPEELREWYTALYEGWKDRFHETLALGRIKKLMEWPVGDDIRRKRLLRRAKDIESCIDAVV